MNSYLRKEMKVLTLLKLRKRKAHIFSICFYVFIAQNKTKRLMVIFPVWKPDLGQTNLVQLLIGRITRLQFVVSHLHLYLPLKNVLAV